MFPTVITNRWQRCTGSMPWRRPAGCPAEAGDKAREDDLDRADVEAAVKIVAEEH